MIAYYRSQFDYAYMRSTECILLDRVTEKVRENWDTLSTDSKFIRLKKLNKLYRDNVKL